MARVIGLLPLSSHQSLIRRHQILAERYGHGRICDASGVDVESVAQMRSVAQGLTPPLLG